MVSHALRIAFFPLAALLLGLGWQVVHPEGVWRTGLGAKEDDGFPRVTWTEAAPRVEAGEWLLIDARGEELYEAGHIPGAVSLPSFAYPEFLTFFAEEHGGDKTAVVYCGSEDCDLSYELADRLRREVGWRDVRILEGGYLAWRRTNP